METARIVVDENLAKEELRKYREAKAPKTAQDLAIMRAYRQVARGKVIIQAHKSIVNAGLNEKGYPVLAITKATSKKCWCHISQSEMSFRWNQWPTRHQRIDVNFEHPYKAQGWEYCRRDGEAIVPLVPVHLRPKGSLVNYHILWEAVWSKAAPVDPMLLKHLSGDLWLVCAAWDLTDIERAVLEQG